MRILVAIPHFYGRHRDSPAVRYGSTRDAGEIRASALAACITSLHQLYGPAQHIILHSTRTAQKANQRTTGTIDVVVCTTGDDHLIGRLGLPAEAYTHHLIACTPWLLGFECHAVLQSRMGDYDYYVYLEDDLISRDPWLFVKLEWFNRVLDNDVLLQPNRFEVGPLGLVNKAYIDGELADDVTAPFQDVSIKPIATGQLLGTTVGFERAKNPHSGCFFLDRDTSFVGPLESAATLGIMRTFRVYKPAPESAAFLEIEHYGTSYLGNLRRRVDVAANTTRT
jgi:hypothetical protein